MASVAEGGNASLEKSCRVACRLADKMYEEEEKEGRDWFGRGTGAQTLAGSVESGRRAMVDAMKAQLDSLV